MPSFNKVFIMGHLTRDPALKHLPSNTSVTEFGVACNRKYKTAGGEEREDVVFVDVAAFGKTGEIINQYMTKGKPIFIEGRLKLDSWEDKKDGSKRSKLSIVAESFQFVGGRDGADDGQEQPAARGNYPRTREDTRTKPSDPPFGDEPKFKEADIPF